VDWGMSDVASKVASKSLNVTGLESVKVTYLSLVTYGGVKGPPGFTRVNKRPQLALPSSFLYPQIFSYSTQNAHINSHTRKTNGNLTPTPIFKMDAAKYVHPHPPSFDTSTDCLHRNAASSVSDAVQGTGATASKEANKSGVPPLDASALLLFNVNGFPQMSLRTATHQREPELAPPKTLSATRPLRPSTQYVSSPFVHVHTRIVLICSCRPRHIS